MNQHTCRSGYPVHRHRSRSAAGSANPSTTRSARVLTHCQFINGPEVARLEAALAAYSGAKHVVTCASGTDALLMVLMAKRSVPAMR